MEVLINYLAETILTVLAGAVCVFNVKSALENFDKKNHYKCAFYIVLSVMMFFVLAKIYW